MPVRPPNDEDIRTMVKQYVEGNAERGLHRTDIATMSILYLMQGISDKLLTSSERIRSLTKWLVGLTVALVVLTVILGALTAILAKQEILGLFQLR